MPIELKNASKLKFVYEKLMVKTAQEQKDLIGNFQETSDNMCKQVLQRMEKAIQSGLEFIKSKETKTFEKEIKEFISFIG